MVTFRHFYLVYSQHGLHQPTSKAPGSVAGLQVSYSFLACDPSSLPPQLSFLRVPVLAAVSPLACLSLRRATLLSIGFSLVCSFSTWILYLCQLQ